MDDAALKSGMPQASPIVSVNAISKAYGGAEALKAVSLTIVPGEIHGLVGANGAGKSTLIKVLAGLTQPDSGEIVVDGRRILANSPHLANELGMSFIHQELAFVPGMTVLENIMLGLPKKTRFGLVDWPAIAREVAPIANRVGVRAPLSRQRQWPFDRGKLVDQHHARAGAQSAADCHGRAHRRTVDGGERTPVRHHPRA